MGWNLIEFGFGAVQVDILKNDYFCQNLGQGRKNFWKI
jgi:hypothetical protein